MAAIHKSVNPCWVGVQAGLSKYNCRSSLPIATNLWNREKDGREKPSFQEKTRFREEIGGLGWWAVPALQRSAAMDSYGVIELVCVGLFEFLSEF